LGSAFHTALVAQPPICERHWAGSGASLSRVAKMIQQLRIYEIFESNKEAFHARFRDHAARIMRRYGFQILAMWETKFSERTEFVYLLQWPDEQTKTTAWSDFMQDKEWAEIKRVTSAEHGLLVGKIEDRTLSLTDYSSFRQEPAT
jgi:heme-degrading monooxygenase HmoA